MHNRLRENFILTQGGNYHQKKNIIIGYVLYISGITNGHAGISSTGEGL
jgi:hypothetical protein